MTARATETEAALFERHMERWANARVLDKSDDIVMMLVGAGLELVGGIPAREFLSRYATTLGPLIWIPGSWEPDRRIEILTHEIEHVLQWWDEPVGMAWLYLTHGESRAAFEARAYAAQLELKHARTGVVPPLDDLMRPLDGPAYLLDPEERVHARKILESRATSVASGAGPLSRSARAAIHWMRLEAPHLLASAP